MKENFNYNKNKNEFTKEMLNDTLKHQKQYNFNIGENNEASDGSQVKGYYRSVTYNMFTPSYEDMLKPDFISSFL